MLASPGVSSLASVHRSDTSLQLRTKRVTSVIRSRLRSDAALGSCFALALSAFVLVSGGGAELEPNTWAEIALLLFGVGVAAVAILRAAPPRGWGAVALVLFGLTVALSACSIAWSVQGDNSWIETNRLLSYLAVFGGALMLARLIPQRYAALIGALAGAATLLSAYALLAKVFPGSLGHGNVIGRLTAPFDYWNAVGLIAASGLAPCVWAGSRRGVAPGLRALCVPAVSILITAIVLSYSRSALLAAAIALALWFVLTPGRLRGAFVLALGGSGAAILTLWALRTHPLTQDAASLASRSSAGHSFGLVLALVLAVMLASGLAGAFAMDRSALHPGTRRAIGTALIVAVSLVPFGGLAALVASKRGLTGEVSHLWDSATNSTQVTGDVPGRLVELANTRPRYWAEAIRVGEHNLLGGAGAGGFGTARSRYTSDPWLAGHAHSYIVETFADFGLLGLLLNAALLAAWALASVRTLRGGARDAAPTERTGMYALLCVVVAFGVSSAVDWTWFVPGTAVVALLGAGWLAGRGALSAPVTVRRGAAELLSRPAAVGGLAALALAGLLLGWGLWQPLRSAAADSAAVAAIAKGNIGAAITDARVAAARDPLSVEPHWELSAIFSAVGNPARARAELLEATRLQPENPATWRQLGLYDLQHHQPGSALAVLRRALTLDRASYPTLDWIAQARAALRPAASAR